MPLSRYQPKEISRMNIDCIWRTLSIIRFTRTDLLMLVQRDSDVIEACKKQTFPARFSCRSQVHVEHVSYCSRGLWGKPSVCGRLLPIWQVWLVDDDDSLVPSSWREAVSHCQPPHKRQEVFRVIITHKQLMHQKQPTTWCHKQNVFIPELKIFYNIDD